MTTTLKPDTARALRVALALKNMTRKNLSESVGLSQNQISRLATGAQAIRGDTLHKIACAFDMKVSEFLALGED